MKKYGEQKEQLLMDIEGTANWRRTKAQEFPQSEKINLHAADALDKLAAWVEKLPESHLVFKAYWSITGETEIETFNNKLRSYGYQNQSETPEEFINTIVQEADLNRSSDLLDSIFEENE